MYPIDINEIVNNPNITISIASNNKENPNDACIRRSKEIVMFIIAIFFVLSAFIFCGYVILNNGFSEDDKKWAMAIAGSIISAFLGYLTGKSIS